MEDIEDLSKMKVADLKKQLKMRGLPVTGNKTELVERLQEALQSALADENPTLDSSGGVDDEEFDEEEILGGEDVDIKITQEEEAAALAGNIRVKTDSLLMPEIQPEKKKISLKRSDPCLSFPAETVAPVEETTPTEQPEINANTNSSNDKENSLTENSEEPKRKIIKLTGLDSENTAEARAKKFGTLTNPDSEESRKQARAARFGTSLSPSDTSKNKRAPKLSMETGGTDLEKLKKRAERFGEVTSKSLSKLEMLEKMKKRQDRFSSETSDSGKEEKTTDAGSDVAKEARTARFGTETKKTASTTTDEEAKTKRAQRFGV